MVVAAVQGDRAHGLGGKVSRSRNNSGARGTSGRSSTRGTRQVSSSRSNTPSQGGARSEASSFPSMAVLSAQASCVAASFASWDRRHRGTVSVEDAQWVLARRHRMD